MNKVVSRCEECGGILTGIQCTACPAPTLGRLVERVTARRNTRIQELAAEFAADLDGDLLEEPEDVEDVEDLLKRLTWTSLSASRLTLAGSVEDLAALLSLLSNPPSD